jgi:signal transduction histidine kinase
MNTAAVKPTVIALCLGASALIGGWWLYQRTVTIAPAVHQDITETITQLNAADTRWNEEILKSRLLLSTNYDSLVKSLTAQNELEQHLSSQLATIATDTSTLRVPLAEYQASVKAKSDLIEQFKNPNSVLRNSTVLIATSIRVLSERIKKAKNDSPANAKLFGEIDEHLGSILLGFLEYSTQPKEHTAALMERHMQAVRELARAPQVSPGVNDFLMTTLAQVDAVIRSKPVVDELLGKMLSVPTVQDLGKIRDAYEAFYAEAQRRGNAEQALFIGYLAVLAVLATFFTLRILNKRRIGLLTAMNEALEKKVELSKELDKAYQELKASQARLIQTEKMSALGQMVAGVAHQLNTPLAFSHNNVSMALESLKDLEVPLTLANKISDQLRHADSGRLWIDVRQAKTTLSAYDPANTDIEMLSHMLGDTLQGIDQMKELVENLRDFTRLDRAKLTDFDINKGLHNVVYIAKSVIPTRVRVTEDYEQLPTLRCNPSQLNQVFLNLINNAAQAIAGDGTITVKSSLEGDRVRIDVMDTGGGIPPDVLPRIFDDYFTTKPRGEGTGLGLPIAKTIVEEHGGDLTVASKVGVGSTFTVRLPISTATATAAELQKAA